MNLTLPIRKLTASLIFSFALCLLFFGEGVFSAAPLFSIMLRGYFTQDYAQLISNFHTNRISLESENIICACVQALLWLCSIFAIFKFLQQIIKLAFGKDRYVRRMYNFLFFIELVLPNVLLLICGVFNFSIRWLFVALCCAAISVFIFSIVVAQKLFPNTKVVEFRERLFKA